MSSTTAFVFAASALLIAVLTALLVPLLRKSPPPRADEQKDANLAIFRDQLAELERERGEGLLADADFTQARGELQRRLLEDVEDGKPLPALAGRETSTAVLLSLALPLAAAAVYLALGTPKALEPAPPNPGMNAQQIDVMLERLAERLKANPQDHKGWVMLARSYKALGRFAESADAFGRGGPLVDENPALLADYAEVLLQISNGDFAGKPNQLIARALKIDPEEPQALFLAGAGAADRGDHAAAVTYWNRLLKQLEPNSDDARALAEAIGKAKEMAGPSAKKGERTPTLAPETVSGKITLSNKLAGRAEANELLFVFARTEEGSRMPLAVLRHRVADLPLTFRLDDTKAIPGGPTLSGQKIVTIEARIAKSGAAQGAPGDLYGVARRIKPGSRDVSIVIDTVQH